MMGNVEQSGLTGAIEQDPGRGMSKRTHEPEFRSFVVEVEPRLRRAFVAAYGGERGRKATAEALAYAWENWEQLKTVTNVPGYLYRVGQSRTRSRMTPPSFSPVTPDREHLVEPALDEALKSLTERQRSAVLLVHAFGWTLQEVADHTGVKLTTIQNHLERGLAKLREKIGDVSHD
jgi:DNA-directed RNA polymerase specialized sigma24 family protein